MPDASGRGINVEVRGRWGGRDVVRLATLRFAGTELELSGGGDDLRLDCGLLDDATWARSVLTLYAAPDALRFVADEADHDALAALWATLVEHAGAVPEMARGLRSLGRSKSGDPQHQQRFVAPLLAARRRLLARDSVERRAAAFDARGVSQRLQQVAVELAQASYPVDGALRRAQEALLEEALEGTLSALAALQDQTTVVMECPDGRRLAEWRVWLVLLRRVFVESERSCRSVARVAPVST